ncbi:MAG: multiheme c-type cytochrome [Micropepsaceae bacterium]
MVFRAMSLGSTRLFCLSASVLLLLALSVRAHGAEAPTSVAGRHEGVATCSGSTCHSRLAPVGTVVRQNEISTWQDISSAAGAHSRALNVLQGDLAQEIVARLGLGPSASAPECLGCHTDYPIAEMRGPRFHLSDGVGCEACHGASSGWIASHYAVGATHQDNIAKGMLALDIPAVRAGVCLDCHLGSDRGNQFVSHEMMSAGHPRISFELDLFSALQSHYDIDADYAERKSVPGAVKMWAVGQAMAVDRALSLFAGSSGAQSGMFPELYFYDCHSCHRAISDSPDAPRRTVENTGRPIPSGTPPFNDSNMMMLSAAARIVAPQLAENFEDQSRSFHAALALDRQNAIVAAGALSVLARQMSAMIAEHSFSADDNFEILDAVMGEALSSRYTDYAGGEQAVMATDTLLSALIAAGYVEPTDANAIRPSLDRLYDQTRDVNAYRPAEFRETLMQVRAAIRGLR